MARQKLIPFFLNDARVTGYFYDPVSKVIYYMQMIDAKRVKFSTGETEFGKARVFVNKELKARLTDKRAPKVKTLLREQMEVVRNRYRQNADAGGAAKGTLTSALAAYKKLEEFWGEMLPEDITKENWGEFQTWCEQKYKGEGQFNTTKFMRVLVTHLIETDHLIKRPKLADRFKKRDEAKLKKKKHRIFTDEEIGAVEKVCKTPDRKNYLRGLESETIFLLGLEMGFRICDCTNLSWDRVHLKLDHPEFQKPDPNLDDVCPTISFHGNDDKADTTGEVPLSDRVFHNLVKLKASAESPWVFPQKGDKSSPIKPQQFGWEDIRRDAKVHYGTFHTLRHTRLSLDFKDPRFTASQVMLVRRVSYEVALEHYIHVSKTDLILLRNAARKPGKTGEES